ncbi:MAG: hypothetical protein ACKV0T_09405 [Planctomycetales bacterium]
MSPLPSASEPSATAPAPSCCRRRVKLLGGVLGLLGVLLLFAPQLVGWSPLRHELPRYRMAGFSGAIRVGKLSLAWWRPVVIEEVEFDAPDGKPFLTVGRITEPRPLAMLVLHPGEPSQVVIERPVVTLRLRADGSNVEDALLPVLAQRKRRPPKERSAQVIDGQFQVIDEETGRTVRWTDLAIQVDQSSDGQTPNTLALSTRLEGAPQADPLKLDLTWTGGDASGAKPPQSQEVTLTTGNLPLDCLAPLLGRIAPDMELSGTTTGRCTLHMANPSAEREAFTLRVEADMRAQQVRATSPSRLGSDVLALNELAVAANFSCADAVCDVERLTVTSDVGQISAAGKFPLPSLNGEGLAAPPLRLGDESFEATGELDLVRLTQLLPATLRLRDKFELTQGKVQLEASSRAGETPPRWKGRLETTVLAGEVEGEKFSWNEPLAITLDAYREEDRWEIERLTCQSEFVELAGSGNTHGLKLTGGADLDQVAARLGQFIDLRDRQLQGKVRVTADWKLPAQGEWELATQVEVDNFLLRQQVTTYVKRRRGEVEEVEAAPPPEAAPRPAPGTRVDPRTRRAMAKAERQSRRQARQQEREVRRKEAEIVLVPVQEWKTLWSDERLTLETLARLDRQTDRVDLSRLEVQTSGLHLAALGTLEQVSKRAVIDLHGEVDYDVEPLLDRMRDTIGEQIRISGQEHRRFSLVGPLRGAPAVPGAEARAPLVPLELRGEAGAGWHQGNLYGLEVGPANFDWRLDQGVLAMAPAEIPLSGGRLRLAPRVQLSQRPATLILPAGNVIDDVQLSQELCQSWLRFVAPILSEATRVEGRFSLDLEESALPLPDPASGQFGGRLHIPAAQVLPGPLFDDVGQIIATVESAVLLGGTLTNLTGLDKPLVLLEDQRVEFTLRDRRWHHTPLEFRVRNVVVRTSGSVGVDESLELVAEIVFPSEWARRVGFLSRLEGEPLQIPIGGTLRQPQVDASGIRQSFEQLGTDALDGLLQGGLRRLFE